MWQIREGGSSAQWMPVRICRTRRVSVSLPSSNQLTSAPSRVNSRSLSSCGTLRRIGIEVPDVVGEQIEPLFVPALVQQLGLAVQEVLDLLPDEQTVDVTHFSPSQLAASMNCRQRR